MIKRLISKLKKETKEEIKTQSRDKERYRNILDDKSITTVLNNFDDK